VKPKLLAIRRGSSYTSDGEQALRELVVVMQDVMGGETYQSPTARPRHFRESTVHVF
jgi:hypothetical protein